MDYAELISAASKLPARKREKFAEVLLASLSSPSRGHVERMWAQESESRIEGLLGGKITTVRGESVLRYRARK